MVLLTMSAATVAAVKQYNNSQITKSKDQSVVPTSDPDITDPALGKPISHGQLVEISKFLKNKFSNEVDTNGYTLDNLLRGSKIYVTVQQPKRETTSEYKELMKRLRHEEEDRQYRRMLNSFDVHNQEPILDASASNKQDDASDEMTFADVNRQVALIANVLLSIIACSVAVWLVASGWSAPTRLALSFSGGILVAVAEVGVYFAYLQRLQAAKHREKNIQEKKKITSTWVIEGQASRSPESLHKPVKSTVDGSALRQRKV